MPIRGLDFWTRPAVYGKDGRLRWWLEMSGLAWCREGSVLRLVEDESAGNCPLQRGNARPALAAPLGLGRVVFGIRMPNPDYLSVCYG